TTTFSPREARRPLPLPVSEASGEGLGEGPRATSASVGRRDLARYSLTPFVCRRQTTTFSPREARRPLPLPVSEASGEGLGEGPGTRHTSDTHLPISSAGAAWQRHVPADTRF